MAPADAYENVFILNGMCLIFIYLAAVGPGSCIGCPPGAMPVHDPVPFLDGAEHLADADRHLFDIDR